MDQVKEYGPLVQQVGGTILSASGDVSNGNSQKRLADYQAKQMESNAKQAVAVGTFNAAEEQRKSALIASRAIAVAAASGGGALDPTVVKILQGISSEGTLNSATEMYNANERARGMNDQAKATRYSGKQAATAGRMKAMRTVLSEGSKIATTWGGSDDGGFDNGYGMPKSESFNTYYGMSKNGNTTKS